MVEKLHLSAFTEKGHRNLNDCGERSNEKVNVISIIIKIALAKLIGLNDKKSQGAEDLHPEVLKEMAKRWWMQ